MDIFNKCNEVAGYAADFRAIKDGRAHLVEINDAHSLGSYGLQNNLYAKLLSASWKEMLETEDEFPDYEVHFV